MLCDLCWKYSNCFGVKFQQRIKEFSEGMCKPKGKRVRHRIIWPNLAENNCMKIFKKSGSRGRMYSKVLCVDPPLNSGQTWRNESEEKCFFRKEKRLMAWGPIAEGLQGV